MGIYSDIVFPTLEPLITKGLWKERRRLLQGVRGDVLEIGPGAGENFKYLPPGIRSYYAIDPSPAFIKKAYQKSQKMNERPLIKVIQAKGEDLPFKSKSFDAVICFLVLCSVNDPYLSLAEIHRVLNPGGKLVFFEHVLSEKQAVARLQHLVNPVWRILGCGCELNRNTAFFVKKAGFDFIRFHRYPSPRMGPRFTSEVIEGAAVKSPPEQ
jgi:ubiquinone/menaquinone biosynthesis C-methylase UbiE